MISLACTLLVGVAAHASEKDDGRTLAQKAAARFPQPIQVGALLNRTVLQPLESQPKLGTVKAIVRAEDKSIIVVVQYGGFFGFGSRPIAVPVHAMVLLGQYVEIVDFTPNELASFPRYAPAGTIPLPPNEIIRVGLARPSH